MSGLLEVLGLKRPASAAARPAIPAAPARPGDPSYPERREVEQLERGVGYALGIGERGDGARELQAVIGWGTAVAATVERMIRWMDLGAARGTLDEFERQLEQMQREHLSLYPKRATVGAPGHKAPFEVKESDPVPEAQEVQVDGGKTIVVGPGNEREVLEAFGDNWFTLKKALKAHPKAMTVMWRYRKAQTDAVLDTIRKDYFAGNTRAVRNVGSATLESDIDVGIDAHGVKDGNPVEDWQVVHRCNEIFQREFGCQPGILFDVNFYANAPAPASSADASTTKTPVEKDMAKMAVAGQDVGALMKMRRYMDAHAWDQYQTEVVAAVTEPALRAATLRQFEEADAKYLMSVRDLLETAKTLDTNLKVPAIADGEDLGAAQQAILAAFEKLEDDPELVMRANNTIYVKRMEELRKLEALAKTQKDDAQAATRARMATLMPDATFFANEAYHADSTFKHVVGAGQMVGKEADAQFKALPDETADAKQKREKDKKAFVAKATDEALGKLSANDLLQSFNEQLGDLMKDLKHYQSEPYPGLGFYRCSKYMERALDALAWIRKRYAAAYPEVKNLTIGGKTPEALKAEIAGGLVLARKGTLSFKDADGSELQDDQRELEAYAIAEVGRIFGNVTTLVALGGVFTKAGAVVNAALRKAAAGDAMKAGDERAYFKGVSA